MTAFGSAFINNTYVRVNSLEQAPHSRYENPIFAYIPVIGILASSFAQFYLSARLDELEQAFKDMRITPSALYIQKKAIEGRRKIDQLVNENEEQRQQGVYEHHNSEIAGLQQKVEALKQETPRIASTALKLIEASNHHAIVSIIQCVLLSALVISILALEILNPAIGIPFFMVCTVIIAGHSGILAQNKLEKIQHFRL